MPKAAKRDLVKEFLAYIQVEKGLALRTIESYALDLKRLEAFAAESRTPLPELTRPELQKWIANLSREGLAPSSIARMTSAVRGFYRFLAIDGYIKTEPAADLATPQRSAYLPHFLNKEQIESLLAAPDIATAAGIRDRAMIELFYASGLRVSELVRVTRRDLNFEAGLVLCHGKGSKERVVPMGKSALHWLQKYTAVKARAGRASTAFVFLNRGRPVTRRWAWAMIKRHATKAGLPNVSPHTLRHSFATHMVQNGADSRSVQLLLGHSDISTTQIYTHITSVDQRRAFDSFHPRARHPPSTASLIKDLERIVKPTA